ncbi:hypothetical protein LSUE1_G010254 [Lachnellula suecica]|uniref:SAP domain-containing protein n=1 Tax=Lachnellula suecica TaxID=602035 RepID=A0A8T9BST7_9HELO|nr:hypothetical protein LSUE1_G010254 [Lachnellula suecica]
MTDWNKLKVVDLKAELKKRGLPQTGLKPALVARLATTENEEGTESEATLQGDSGRHDVATSPDTVSSTQQPSDPIAEVLPDAPLQAASEPEIESSAQTTTPIDAPQESPSVGIRTEPLAQATTVIEFSQPRPQSQDSHQSALPSAEPQEIMDDRQKRKRRSQSPPPTAPESARKRARQDETAEVNTGVVTSKEDAEWVEKHIAVESAEINADAMEVAPAGEGVEPGPTIVDTAKEEVHVQSVPGVNTDETAMQIDDADRPKSQPGQDENSPRVRDSRFKDLFPAQPKAPALEKSLSRDSALDNMDIDTDRVISPAVHHATSALYIRDFMRPLNPAQLKSYLATLATPPGHDTDPNVILNFFLDPIRTHAFVSLISVSAASRIRSAIHDRIWPEERTRKPLWADFIPAEKVDKWIGEEQSTTLSGGRATGKKWEVHYDVDEDRNVTATLQESSGFPRMRQPSGPGPLVSPQAPPKPRGIEGAPLGPRADTQVRIPIATSISQRLDHFKVTTAKPALYYQPVSKELANKRLDNIDIATSKKNYPPGGEINRYTFEDADVLVDRGPEIFTGIRPPPSHRGPASRAGGPRGGPYRGRVYAGGPERSYDSYRGSSSYRGGRRDSRDERF